VREGAQVIINAPAFEELPVKWLSKFKNTKNKPVYLEADVADPDQVNRLFDEVESRFGRLDILINNAGISQSKDIFSIEFSDWKKILAVNLDSGFLCSKRAMLLMQKQKYGRIIFISSMVAHQGALFGHLHYAASKSGQLGLMKTLARTAAKYGITVNAVAPGIIDTELLRATHGEKGISRLAKNIPLGVGRPEDVSNAVAFLCSEHACYITGATLDVNGGMYMR
jgi:NAD(P)-dependent dehydrogenase (short-subunit alcohol dehydrogenase family)